MKPLTIVKGLYFDSQNILMRSLIKKAILNNNFILFYYVFIRHWLTKSLPLVAQSPRRDALKRKGEKWPPVRHRHSARPPRPGRTYTLTTNRSTPIKFEFQFQTISFLFTKKFRPLYCQINPPLFLKDILLI